MTEIKKAMTLIELDEKWRQPFDVEDPFLGLRLEGRQAREGTGICGFREGGAMGTGDL